jgi:glycosyltransferase involved in cell wall biosynthesis
MTTYSRERYLGAAIESVLAQTCGDFELLLWDDGSTDRSVALARAYARQDARVRVVAAPHLGRTPALKAAVAHAAGTYVGLVDSDDLLAPTALEETMAILDAQPEVGMVYTDYLDIDAHGAVRGYGQRCHIPYSQEGLLLNFMTFHFRLIRRTVLEQVGDFDTSFACAQDYDLCLRLAEVTEVRHLAKPLYYYRVHPDGISQGRAMEQIRCSYKAIRAALQRRGLAAFLELKLRIHKIGQHLDSMVFLRPRKSWRQRLPKKVVQT